MKLWLSCVNFGLLTMVKLNAMNVKDLMNHYECKNHDELSKKINFSRVTLWKWEKFGIPPRTQATFEVLSGGVLKADLQALTA